MEEFMQRVMIEEQEARITEMDSKQKKMEEFMQQLLHMVSLQHGTIPIEVAEEYNVHPIPMSTHSQPDRDGEQSFTERNYTSLDSEVNSSILSATDSCSLDKDGHKKLSNKERHSIYEALLKVSKNGKIRHGCVKTVATMHKVCTKTVHRIWNRATSSLEEQPYADVSHRFNQSGRKRKYIDFDKILDIPLRRRTNIRSLSNAMEVPKSTIHRGVKEGKIRSHSNAIKPRLTEENKRSRVRFCLSMLETPCLCKQPTFKGMLDVVHIDEKFFWLSKESINFYLHPSELEPHRTCQSKSNMAKVMFLAAVARPRFDHLRNEEFSGKIGIFPFVVKEPAKRKSKNRAAGTLETKAIMSVTKDVYRRYLIDKVLPAIREKWPRGDGIQKIYIQQDNAKPHINSMDHEFRQVSSIGGFEMELIFQPSNSPDMNILDLGYFNSIQSLQHQKAPSTIDELVQAVEDSFNELSAETLNDVFLTLQASMVEVLKNNGGFDYKLQHIGKEQMKRAGTLPFQLDCQLDIVESAATQLQSDDVSRWSDVRRWVTDTGHVCMKHHIGMSSIPSPIFSPICHDNTEILEQFSSRPISENAALNSQENQEQDPDTGLNTSYANKSVNLGILPSPPVEQSKRRRQKRLYDEKTVLTNKFIKEALEDSSDLKRRKNDWSSSLEFRKLNNKKKQEKVFLEPVITGLCNELCNMFNEDYISSKNHLVRQEEAHPDPNVAQSLSRLDVVLRRPDALYSDNVMAYDNAVSALGKICQFQRDGINASQENEKEVIELPDLSADVNPSKKLKGASTRVVVQNADDKKAKALKFSGEGRGGRGVTSVAVGGRDRGGRGRGGFMNFGERKNPSYKGEKEVLEGAPDCLSGLTFVISGALDSLRKKEAEDLIKCHGGRITGSVSKKTSYLLCDKDIGGRKSSKAKELGTGILTEDGLFDMIRASSRSKPATTQHEKYPEKKVDSLSKESSHKSGMKEAATSSEKAPLIQSVECCICQEEDSTNNLEVSSSEKAPCLLSQMGREASNSPTVY